MIRVCFVCLGNICRSPTAEGVMQHLVREAGLEAEIAIDSAGTAGYHEGKRADSRSRKAAEARGFQLESRARQFRPEDFDRFDYILAMDQNNYEDILAQAVTAEASAKVHLFRSFDSASPEGAGVPDPYYGGADGFDEVLDICEAGCAGLLDHIRATHGIGGA